MSFNWTQHPSGAELKRYISGDTSKLEKKNIKRHILHCLHCLHRVETLQRTGSILKCVVSREVRALETSALFQVVEVRTAPARKTVRRWRTSAAVAVAAGAFVGGIFLGRAGRAFSDPYPVVPPPLIAASVQPLCTEPQASPAVAAVTHPKIGNPGLRRVPEFQVARRTFFPPMPEPRFLPADPSLEAPLAFVHASAAAPPISFSMPELPPYQRRGWVIRLFSALASPFKGGAT